MGSNPWDIYQSTQYPSIYGGTAGMAGAPAGIAPVGAADPSAGAAAAAGGGSSALMGAGIGAGLGLLSSIGAQNAAKYAAKAAATQTRFSPWTKMGAGTLPANPAGLGQLLGYGAAGATLGQKIGS